MKSYRALVMIGGLLAMSLFSLKPSAGFGAGLEINPRFWQVVEENVRECVIYPVYSYGRGKLRGGNLRSLCPQIRVLDEKHAQIIIHGEPMLGTISDSPESDGGDLNHLIIQNRFGQVIARRENVPAFGDVLLALLGGKINGVRMIQAGSLPAPSNGPRP